MTVAGASRSLRMGRAVLRPFTSALHRPSARACSTQPHSYQQQLERRLSALGGPAYSVPADSITCLGSPSEFHQAILHHISQARSRVCLSALYLGTDPLSLQIVEALTDALQRNPQLQVHVLLDCLRATRQERGSGDSSVSVLSPLVTGSSGRAALSLFHSPKLSGMLKKVLPPRWNETISLLHLKCLVFDDQLILTGANLSGSYFENRQDRYMQFDQCKPLADHFAKLTDAIGSLSYSFQSSGELAPPRVDPVEQTAHFKQVMKLSIGAPTGPGMPNEWRDESKDTVVYPTVQFGPAEIRHDEACTLEVLSSMPKDSTLMLSTGYFNCTSRYERVIVGSGSTAEVWVAAPCANGFYGATGAANLIPRAYSLLAEWFHKRIAVTGRVTLREWARGGWTYHAKGLWVDLPGGAGPVVTMVGSPNFGERSVHRDLEASAIVITRNEALSKRLAKEKAAIRAHTSLTTEDTWEQAGRFGDPAFDENSTRRGFAMRLVTRLCRGFL